MPETAAVKAKACIALASNIPVWVVLTVPSITTGKRRAPFKFLR